MTTNMTKIDGEALKRELLRRGVKVTEASKALGYCSTYISKAATTGQIRPVAIQGLEHLYNIKPETYVVKEKEPIEDPPAVVPAGPVQLDYEELYKCIYLAVYKAVQKAWGE